MHESIRLTCLRLRSVINLEITRLLGAILFCGGLLMCGTAHAQMSREQELQLQAISRCTPSIDDIEVAIPVAVGNDPWGIPKTGGASTDGATGLGRRGAPGAEDPGAEETAAGTGHGVHQHGVGSGPESPAETTAHESPDRRTDPARTSGTSGWRIDGSVAAEIFALPLCLTPAQLAIGTSTKSISAFHTLDGVLVQQAPVGALGHCLPLAVMWRVDCGYNTCVPASQLSLSCRSIASRFPGSSILLTMQARLPASLIDAPTWTQTVPSSTMKRSWKSVVVLT